MAGLIEQLVARESTSCTSPSEREGHWKWALIYKRNCIQSSDHDANVHTVGDI